MVQTAILRGRDHQRVGGLELVGEGPAAIALSRGGAPKTYSHTDPNEDCAAFALGETGILTLVADGHHGQHGSEAALEAVLTEFAEPWTGDHPPARSAEQWRDQAFAAMLRANQAVLERAGREQLAPAPTTFVLALVRPADDLLLSICVGDSHLFAIEGDAALEIGRPDPAWRFTPFLGYEQATRESLERFTTVETRRLAGLRALVLATDGLSEQGIGVPEPARDVYRIAAWAELESPAGRRPVDVCRAVTETALESHRRHRSGDNIACSVLWLGD